MGTAVSTGRNPYADAGLTQAAIDKCKYDNIPFVIPATELAAGTTIELVAPQDGTIANLLAVVNTAIVTGGGITVNVNGVAVVGLLATLADGATKGTRVQDAPTAGDATANVKAGDRIEIVPAAAFTGGGAVNGILSIERT